MLSCQTDPQKIVMTREDLLNWKIFKESDSHENKYFMLMIHNVLI